MIVRIRGGHIIKDPVSRPLQLAIEAEHRLKPQAQPRVPTPPVFGDQLGIARGVSRPPSIPRVPRGY